jgi:hypothetical protein
MNEYNVVILINGLIYKAIKIMAAGTKEARMIRGHVATFGAGYINELRAIKKAKELQAALFVAQPEVDILDFNCLI